jgi:methylmalonyl-CoA mutase
MLEVHSRLFTEFDTVSKDQWLQRIEKDLKGRALDNLDWHLPHLTVSPFAHADDVIEQALAPIAQNKDEKNRWNIVANIQVNSDVKQASKQALSALMGGANALCFFVDNYPNEITLNTLLENIELDYISTFFSEKTTNRNPLLFLKLLYNVAKSNQKDPKILRGGIHFDPFADGKYDVKVTTELLLWAHENLPLFKVVIVNSGRFFSGSENVVEELTQTLKSAENYLNRLINKDLSIEIISNHIAFNCTIGLSYFVEIAKLRALKLLWGNILAAYDTAPKMPYIYATISAATQVDDSNSNKIRATTQAMSAAIGGIQSLAIHVDMSAAENDSDLHQRIALNVNHLLQMESYFDQVQDPAAGSYYIEQLTTQIAEKTWERFRNL